jgi:hypothetical protein
LRRPLNHIIADRSGWCGGIMPIYLPELTDPARTQLGRAGSGC